MGRLAAENIANSAAHDLWSVNTDYESYQEAATITETGIATQQASISTRNHSRCSGRG